MFLFHHLKLSFLVRFGTHYCVLGKLLSACPLLEELTIRGGSWQNRKSCRTVSSSTLKKLTILCTERVDYWDITLDTPSLAYLEYSDLVPKHYPFVNLESLVEAKLDLGLGYGNPSNLIEELQNVEVLELSGHTCKTFCHFREAIPVFSNLYRLSITIDSFFYDWDWELLPILLEKSPNLHTLIFKGPLYADKYEREYGLSCPVKVLKITEYGGKIGELEQMKRFLEKLSCLELVEVLAYAINDKEKSRITKDLLMVPRSPKCNIQIKFCENFRKLCNA